jgi:hypothetical protein
MGPIRNASLFGCRLIVSRPQKIRFGSNEGSTRVQSNSAEVCMPPRIAQDDASWSSPCRRPQLGLRPLIGPCPQARLGRVAQNAKGPGLPIPGRSRCVEGVTFSQVTN